MSARYCHCGNKVDPQAKMCAECQHALNRQQPLPPEAQQALQRIQHELKGKPRDAVRLLPDMWGGSGSSEPANG